MHSCVRDRRQVRSTEQVIRSCTPHTLRGIGRSRPTGSSLNNFDRRFEYCVAKRVNIDVVAILQVCYELPDERVQENEDVEIAQLVTSP